MKQQVEALKSDFLGQLEKSKTSQDIQQLKIRFLGKKGPITDLMKGLKDASAEEKPILGQEINTLKTLVSEKCDEAIKLLTKKELLSSIENEKLDVTEKGRQTFSGSKHPIIQTLDEITEILVGMGFSVQLGPDIDDDYHNFGGLNFTEDHPARAMQDTFYLTEDRSYLLRTHTSNTQLRVMENYKPPIRVVTPGLSFRNETVNVRSHVFFHQIEGMYIDENVTFSDLFETMREFLRKLFKKDIKTRFRPSYFPFVEPGVEVDVHCTNCDGKGCRICKYTGWLEILGAGMIHPTVLENGGIDPEKYSGYAWGMGPARLAMLRHGVPDIRMWSENNVDFLKQFNR